MSDRRAMVSLVLGLLAAGCSHPEKGVVDQYFNAVRAGDSQTLASFAAVGFDKKPERWAIKGGTEAQKSPVTLPSLVKKVTDLEAEIAANKKAFSAYALDHYADLDQVKELRKKGQPIPAKFSAAAAEWDKSTDKDRELKKALANAQAAVEKERRSVVRSVGQVDDVDTLDGEMIDKTIDVDVTVQGQTQPYVMTVRKYELKRDGAGGRVMSRWVVQNLQPKA
jgi:hypothetical protein